MTPRRPPPPRREPFLVGQRDVTLSFDDMTESHLAFLNEQAMRGALRLPPREYLCRSSLVRFAVAVLAEQTRRAGGLE